MINEKCNQKCPYCFASEFVNKKNNDITFKNFRKAVKFICSCGPVNSIGIIGGEPLLHPLFDKFIKYLSRLKEVDGITIFTNGVFLLNHLECINSNKTRFLINVNSPKDVGESNFSKTVEAIKTLLSDNRKRNRLTIGLNIYDEKMDYSFFINLANKFDFRIVRLSIVVPAYGKEKTELEHFYRLKKKTLEIVKHLLVKGICFHFDCNLPVPCLWSEEEKKDLMLMGLMSDGRELIPIEKSKCSPVVDILPDLTAIRCFGLSDVSKVSIKNFKNIMELKDYYVENFDNKLCKVAIDKKCENCKLFFEKKCYGGCLANRSKI